MSKRKKRLCGCGRLKGHKSFCPYKGPAVASPPRVVPQVKK